MEIELKAIEMTAMRLLYSDKHREKGKPNPMSSVLKIKGAETQRRSAELMLKAAGPHAIVAKWEGNGADDAVETLNGWAEGKASTFFFSRAASIFGGSNEMQRKQFEPVRRADRLGLEKQIGDCHRRRLQYRAGYRAGLCGRGSEHHDRQC